MGRRRSRGWTAALLLAAVVVGCDPEKPGEVGTQPTLEIFCSPSRAVVGQQVSCHALMDGVTSADYPEPLSEPGALGFVVSGGLSPSGDLIYEDEASFHPAVNRYGQDLCDGLDHDGYSEIEAAPLYECDRRCCEEPGEWHTDWCPDGKSLAAGAWTCTPPPYVCCVADGPLAPRSYPAGGWQITTEDHCLPNSIPREDLSLCHCHGDPSMPSTLTSLHEKGATELSQEVCWPHAAPWLDAYNPIGFCEGSDVSVKYRLACEVGGGTFAGRVREGEAVVCCRKTPTRDGGAEPEYTFLRASERAGGAAYNGSFRMDFVAEEPGTATVRLRQLRTAIAFVERHEGSSTATIEIVAADDMDGGVSTGMDADVGSGMDAAASDATVGAGDAATEGGTSGRDGSTDGADAGATDAGVDASATDAGVDAATGDAGTDAGTGDPEVCSGGLDEDGDGQTDCDDSDCACTVDCILARTTPPASILSNGSFESPFSTTGAAPTFVGQWTGDVGDRVGSTLGVDPLDQATMFRFVSTYTDRVPTASATSDIWQLFDARPYVGQRLCVVAHFARVAGDAETDDLFVAAAGWYAGTASSFAGFGTADTACYSGATAPLRQCVQGRVNVEAGSWVTAAAELVMPDTDTGALTGFVLMRAIENVYDDVDGDPGPELDGHFVDDVWLFPF